MGEGGPPPSGGSCHRASREEHELADTLLCKGNVCRSLCRHEQAYCCYRENASILLADVLGLMAPKDIGAVISTWDDSNAAVVGTLFTTSGLVDLLNRAAPITDGQHGSVAVAQAIEALHGSLTLTLEMARYAFWPEDEEERGGHIDSAFSSTNDSFLEKEQQIAEIMEAVGIIHAARYLHGLDEALQTAPVDGPDGGAVFQVRERERERARQYLEESIAARKRRMRTYLRYSNPDMVESNDAKIIVAFALYELGKLFSASALAKRRLWTRRKEQEDQEIQQECEIAIKYFKRSGQVMQKLLELTETLDGFSPAQIMEDPSLQRIQRMPSTFEEMLETMGVLYRCIDAFEEAVECYNAVKMLLTKMNLSATLAGLERDASEENSAASFISMESAGGVTRGQKEKVAKSIQSIGDILREQGEFQRAMEVYSEALQMRRAMAASHQQPNGDLDVAGTLYAMGVLHLQMEEWTMALVRFDESLRLRVDGLPENHLDIALSFHKIGRAYEGSWKFDQALEYYKKALRTKDTFTNADVGGTEIFFDLGSIVVKMDRHSKLEVGDITTVLEQDDFKIALECLSKAHNRYRCHYGDDTIEAADAVSLKGEIFFTRGEYSTAISCFLECLHGFRAFAKEDNLKIATTLRRLGLAYLGASKRDSHNMEEADNGDDDRPIECLDEALSILMEHGYDGTEEHAAVLFDKGCAHAAREEIDLALLCYEGSLSFYQTLLGEDHLRVSEVLERLGSCLIRDREHSQAQQCFQDAVRIRSLNGCADDLNAAAAQFGLGVVCCEAGQYNDSLDCYEEALRIRREQLGADHVDVAQILNNIGSVFARNGEYHRALLPWKDALKMYKKLGLGDDHPKVACTLGNIEISEKLVSIPQQRGVGKKEIRRLDDY